MKMAIQLQRLKLVLWFESTTMQLLRYLSLALGAISLTVLVVAAWAAVPAYLTALALLFLAPFLLTLSFATYIRYLRAHPGYRISVSQKQADPINGFDFTALGALRVLKRTKSWQRFWTTVATAPWAREVMYRFELTPELLTTLFGDIPVDQPLIDQVKAGSIAAAEGKTVTVLDVLQATSALPVLAEYLTSQHLTDQDVSQVLRYYRGRLQIEQRPNNKTGGFAKNWAVSYTNLLDAVTSEAPAGLINHTLRTPLYERTAIIDQLVAALTGASSQSVLLTGPAGIGKTEIFYHLAAKIISYQTKTELDGQSVRLLDVQRLLSLAHSPQQLQQLLESLFAEVGRAGNVILFIDQLDLLLSPDETVGSVNIAAALTAGLQASQLRVVATASTDRYVELVKTNPELQRLLTVIDVPPPSPTELPAILLGHLPRLERRFGVFFSYVAIKELLTLSGRYLKEGSSPLKELRAIEQVATTLRGQGKAVAEASDVRAAIESVAKVPIQVADDERQSLLNIESQLHRRIVGQDAAIKQVSDALLRARAGVGTGNGPIGSFLFLGPTGVGKTETAKALAEIYFGAADRLIRLDLTEYGDDAALAKLLGSDPKRQPGELALAIQKTPSAVVLLDEIEKANPLVKNALMQLVDEGRLTTNYGALLDFTNSIVIATSNAGSDFIRAEILAGKSASSFARELVDQLQSQKIFLTEFLNRFDGIAVFTPLTPAEVRQVVVLQINLLKQRLFKEKGITVELAEPVITELAKRGYDPVFGARSLQRVIQNQLETEIAKQIITNNPGPGSKITVTSLSA